MVMIVTIFMNQKATLIKILNKKQFFILIILIILLNYLLFLHIIICTLIKCTYKWK